MIKSISIILTRVTWSSFLEAAPELSYYQNIIWKWRRCWISHWLSTLSVGISLSISNFEQQIGNPHRKFKQQGCEIIVSYNMGKTQEHKKMPKSFFLSELQELEVQICVQPNFPIIILILLNRFHNFQGSRGLNSSVVSDEEGYDCQQERQSRTPLPLKRLASLKVVTSCRTKILTSIFTYCNLKLLFGLPTVPSSAPLGWINNSW